MVARSYILDTKSVQRNSPLVLAALLTSAVKKYLTQVDRDDLASVVSTVIFFGDSATVVTGRPIINFELRSHEGGIREVVQKMLSNHGFQVEIRISFR